MRPVNSTTVQRFSFATQIRLKPLNVHVRVTFSHPSGAKVDSLELANSQSSQPLPQGKHTSNTRSQDLVLLSRAIGCPVLPIQAT